MQTLTELIQSQPQQADIEAFMQHWSQLGDKFADPVIEAMQGRCEGDWLETIYQRAQSEGDVYQDFIQHIESIPHWVNFEDYKVGRDYALYVAPLGGVALLLGSLMEGYVIPQGANLLASTKKLTEGAFKRIHETGQMVTSVYVEDGLKVGNEGFTTLVKVRLIHAIVRYHVRPHRARIDLPLDEEPINQIGNAFTLTQFSDLVLRNVEKFHMGPNQAESESLEDMWRYVGYLLGVDEAILPKNRAEQAWLHDQVMAIQTNANENSRLLASSLINAVTQQTKITMPSGLMTEFTRFMLGDKVCTELGFEPHKGWRKLVRSLPYVLAPLNFIRQKLPLLQKPLVWFGDWYSQYMVQKGQGGKKTDFNTQP